MSTAARGGGRGGRGRGQSTAIWRGSTARAGHGGASADSSDRPPVSAAKKRGGGAPSRGGSARSTAGSHEPSADGKPTNIAFVPLNKYGAAFNSTPHPTDDYHGRFLYLQAAQPSWRKQLQDQGLMNPDGQMKLSDSVKLIGRCSDMCPEFERVRRIDQKDFKRPECTPETEHLDYAERIPDEARMVKVFTRSSAGADVELVIDLRSPAACLKTVNYLFKRLDNEGFDYLHAWIWDRTRSVRKDLRTQVVEKRNDIQTLLTCLEASARFYLLSMHQMAQSEKEDYSHQQDMEQFNQTLTTLRERYDDNRRAGIASDNEAEFVAYRLILASLYANSQLENELHSLPSDLRHNKRVLTAIEIFKAAKSAFNFGSDKAWIQAQANWTKFWDLIKSPSVSYLMACAAEVGFNRVRHVILDSIWHAYRKGPRGDISVDAWTTDELRHLLVMDHENDVVKLCELFGFSFDRNSQGQAYLDIAKLGNSNKSIGVPHSIKPQMFSRSLVESKRHNRAFSAVIRGLTIQQARTSGLLAEQGNVQMGAEESLFVPENATSKPNIFSQNLNDPKTNSTSGLSPFASPFNPPNQPLPGVSTPSVFSNNLFTQQTPSNQSASLAPSSPFGGAGTPGLFDPTRNQIKFAPAHVPNASGNPFATAAPMFNPQSFTPAAEPSHPLTLGPEPSTASQGQLSGSHAKPGVDQITNHNIPGTPKPFMFPGLSALDANLQQQSAGSATPAGSPPPSNTDVEAAEKQKAEVDKREELLKQREELRKRAQQEEEEELRQKDAQKRAREAEERRIDEERRRQQRQQLERERELKIKQEREARLKEEQEQQQQKEQARLERSRRRERAFNALTSNVMFSGEEGLLYQFLENMVKNTADAVALEADTQRRRARRAAEEEQRKLAFARAVFARWVAQVQKRKRIAKARERRKRLKAQREHTMNSEGEGEAASRVSIGGPSTDTTSRTSVSSARNAPTNTSTLERHTAGQQRAGASQSARPRSTRNLTTPATMTQGGSLQARSYSEAYQKSTAPIDRTETDWFKLRAMGIDPSKHLKRSFDSASDEELKEDIDAKRVRRYESRTPQAPPQPEAPAKLLSIEERLARIRAIKQSLGASGEEQPSISGAAPITTGRSSLNGRSSILMAQARDLITKSPITKHSSLSIHDFGRSVPNLGTSMSSLGQSSFSKSSFGRSVGAAQGSQPAYWGRASRFVPQHLYGKGPEAIRAYRDQYVHSAANTPRHLSTEPIALSSPIPAQLSYVPQPGYTQSEYSEEEGSASGVDLVDVDIEDGVAGDTEEDSFDVDDDNVEDDEGEEIEDDDHETGDAALGVYSEEFDEDEYTEEEDQNFAQPGSSIEGIGPGTTQDDAIELSD